MEYFVYIDTKEISNDTVLAIVHAIAGTYGTNDNPTIKTCGNGLPCTLSASDLDKKGRRQRDSVLGLWFKGDALYSLNLFSWYDHAQIAENDAKLFPCQYVDEFFYKLANDFKYFKFTQTK
jgi:hypothetical protein